MAAWQHENQIIRVTTKNPSHKTLTGLREFIREAPFDHPLLKMIRSEVSKRVGAISNERRHKEAERRKKK
jgi:hypothetical protein